MKHFRAPKESLGLFDAENAATLIAAAVDIALVVDNDGTIKDVALHGDGLSSDIAGASGWIGAPWAETVTLESRPKIQEMLREAEVKTASAWRHLNYRSIRGPDIPILFSAIRLGPERVVAVGRDLRALANLQHRLVEAQQSMERDYSRLRNVEMRYRLLFQLSSEPVLIVDAASQKVVEVNAATSQLFEDGGKRVLDRPFPDLFRAQDAAVVIALLAGVRAAGRADDVRVHLADDREIFVSAHMFRQERASFFLVRLTSLESRASEAMVPKLAWKLLKLVENAPDAFVLTDADGNIVTTNGAFLELAQLASQQQATGQSLDRWLGRPGVDLAVLITNLSTHGSVRLFATTLRGEFGTTAQVEICAVAVMNSQRQCYGFVIRNIGWRLQGDPRPSSELPRSVEHLTQLVGRVSLKELVREATDVIERLSIEAALELTGDNRASAAEMLGLSRQSLYVKLRRYGLADLPAEDDDGR